MENNNTGVIYTETYKAKDGSIKIYSLGFKTVLDKEPVMYYIDKTDLDYKDSYKSNFGHSKLILKLVNELVRSNYSNIRFYCHNLGGFYIVFILNVLYLFNEQTELEDNKYKISLTLKDNKILKCIY